MTSPYVHAPGFDEHERVMRCEHESSGLIGYIAVHSTALGPALGGCRMWPYASEEEALADVLRLSRGQTYKAALANLAMGGGKSVIIGDPRTAKTRELLLAMAGFVDQLGGAYIIAEDSGTGVADMRVMAERTPSVAGLVEAAEHGGDPSPSTAYGVLVGIRAAVRYRLGAESLDGISVAIQGLGNVGYRLACLLAAEGASLLVADVVPSQLDRAVSELGARVVPVDELHSAPADVYAPCALGGAVNAATVNAIKAPVIAGAANNQLAAPQHGEQLRERGILYAPDYAVNAGGIIDIAYERAGGDQAAKRRHLDGIASTLHTIFERAVDSGRSTAVVADELAEERFRR